MNTEKNRRQRNYRKSNNNACTRKYEKTKKGFLMRLYRNMKSRVEGVQYKKAHLYKGKSLLPKEDFYEWANNCLEFHIMFTKWEKHDYCRKLTPTVDRIDSTKGYEFGNIRWLTHSENSKRTSQNKKLTKS